MRSTGIVRKVDELGRVVIPIELRRTLGIEEKDALEIYVDQEKIILKNTNRPVCLWQCRQCAIFSRQAGLQRMCSSYGS